MLGDFAGQPLLMNAPCPHCEQISRRGSDAAVAPICAQLGQTIRVSMTLTTAAVDAAERQDSAKLLVYLQPEDNSQSRVIAVHILHGYPSAGFGAAVLCLPQAPQAAFTWHLTQTLKLPQPGQGYLRGKNSQQLITAMRHASLRVSNLAARPRLILALSSELRLASCTAAYPAKWRVKQKWALGGPKAVWLR
jgi:hypothetical protein